jgi:hypothetical protein
MPARHSSGKIGLSAWKLLNWLSAWRLGPNSSRIMCLMLPPNSIAHQR